MPSLHRISPQPQCLEMLERSSGTRGRKVEAPPYDYVLSAIENKGSYQTHRTAVTPRVPVRTSVFNRFFLVLLHCARKTAGSTTLAIFPYPKPSTKVRYPHFPHPIRNK